LRQRAAQSKGFCALLSCDEGQKSWEFPELGHGVFTYYLMRGLLGEAADSHGVIEADGLYKYVYRQTLQYIDKLNQQVRLVNQQKLNRGESKLHPEYPLQTPKRIVEGVGELILGFKESKTELQKYRQAIVIDGLSNQKTSSDLSRLFTGAGGFEMEYFSSKNQPCSDIRGAIQKITRGQGGAETKFRYNVGKVKNTPTYLLYLRGYIKEIEDGEAWLVLGDGICLSRSWLRQELRRSLKSQQIIILDCPEATSLDNWIEDLQSGAEQGQCIIAAASTAELPQLFSQTVLETLASANPRVGLSIAQWVEQLHSSLLSKGVDLHVWLSGTQTVIDILPGNISVVFQDLPEVEIPETEEKVSFSPPQLSSKVAVSPSISEPPHSVQTKLDLPIDSPQYIQLEQLLMRSIGPIASTLLRKKTRQVRNIKELVDILAGNFPLEQQQQFWQEAIAIFETSTNSSSTTDEVLDDEFISQCERELAYLVGPIASFVIQKILQSNSQLSASEFVKQLAAKIPEPKQALEFEQGMQVKKSGREENPPW
jgi:hypothetical protein